MKNKLEQFTPQTEAEFLEKAKLTFFFEVAFDTGLDIEEDFTEEERRKLNERINNLINQ